MIQEVAIPLKWDVSPPVTRSARTTIEKKESTPGTSLVKDPFDGNHGPVCQVTSRGNRSEGVCSRGLCRRDRRSVTQFNQRETVQHFKLP